MVAYAHCMRANGVPNFPDPTSGGDISISSSNGIDPNSPEFQAAQGKCQNLLPHPSAAQQQQAQQNALKFSQCMRANGVPNFPDPQFSSSGGGARISISNGPGGSGIDPNSPTFQAAKTKCARKLHLPTPGQGGGKTSTQSGGGSGPGSGQVVG